MTSGGNNINNFPESQLTKFVHAQWYDSSLEVSDGMISTRTGKCRCGIPSRDETWL